MHSRDRVINKGGLRAVVNHKMVQLAKAKWTINDTNVPQQPFVMMMDNIVHYHCHDHVDDDIDDEHVHQMQTQIRQEMVMEVTNDPIAMLTRRAVVTMMHHLMTYH
jgi:hypothetical protein